MCVGWGLFCCFDFRGVFVVFLSGVVSFVVVVACVCLVLIAGVFVAGALLCGCGWRWLVCVHVVFVYFARVEGVGGVVVGFGVGVVGVALLWVGQLLGYVGFCR